LLPSSHEGRPMLELALNSGERAAHLVRQMLAYAGKGRFIVEKIDLSEAVYKTWELLRASIPSSIHVQFLTRPGLPPVETDPSQIEQIIMNLIINAAEAIPPERPGHIIVRTDLERIAQPLTNVASDLQPGTYLLLEVRDDGCGMDEATKAKIFDPFFTTKFTGRGLGLAAVQGIVRNSSGAVVVESQPGRGTAFKVLLPPSITVAAPNVIAIDEIKALDPARILVVDDEGSVLDVARMALERAGHQVHVAMSGSEAIELVHRFPGRFTIIVLDLSMPGMGGLETLAQIREINPAVPILLSSGYSEIEMRRRAEGLPVTGFLQKPYTSKDLREKVGFYIRKAQGAARSQNVT
jgi:CheY-like chemotaxis protein